MKFALIPIAALAIGSLMAPHAQAAHAGAPYKNVNKQNDAGNGTGDSEVDRLNSMQLDQNYKGPTYIPGQPIPPAQPMMAPADPTPTKGR